MRHAERELDHLEAAGYFAKRISGHLAVFGGKNVGQVAFAGVQQFTEVVHDRLPFRQRRVSPRRESGQRNGHGVVDVGRAGQADVPGDLAGGGVEDRAGAGRTAIDGCSADPVADDGKFGHVGVLWLW
jgi:hypothetical protein